MKGRWGGVGRGVDGERGGERWQVARTRGARDDQARYCPSKQAKMRKLPFTRMCKACITVHVPLLPGRASLRALLPSDLSVRSHNSPAFQDRYRHHEVARAY